MTILQHIKWCNLLFLIWDQSKLHFQWFLTVILIQTKIAYTFIMGRSLQKHFKLQYTSWCMTWNSQKHILFSRQILMKYLLPYVYNIAINQLVFFHKCYIASYQYQCINIYQLIVLFVWYELTELFIYIKHVI